jgi:hypothetical protein
MSEFASRISYMQWLELTWGGFKDYTLPLDREAARGIPGYTAEYFGYVFH